MSLTVQDVAAICHDANRRLCIAVGDNSQKMWDDADGWQRASAVAGVEYALRFPNATGADQHDAWCTDKYAAGWVYGETKDADKKTHPCLVPYDQLPVEQRAKDWLFRAIVTSLAEIVEE